MLMNVFPVGLQAIDDDLSLLIGQASEGSTAKMFRNVGVILFLCTLHFLLALVEVDRNFTKIL